MKHATSQAFAFALPVLLAALAAGCNTSKESDSAAPSDSGAPTTVQSPTVTSTSPADGATDQVINLSVEATFSVAMDPSALTPTTFVVSTGTPPLPVAGTVIYDDRTATFWPATHLSIDTVYTAMITTDALSVAGEGLADDFTWTFTTGAELAPGLPVDLGTAENFAILAKTGISSVPTSAITGDIGVSPAAATYITGFSLTADATNVFATSPQVTGQVFASDYAVPTPSNMTTAIRDMERAFVDAAGRAPDVTELGAGNIGGLTLSPGVYKWGTGLLIPTDVTLDGSGTDVWIFQIAQDLTLASAARVNLTGGAIAENVFWQVSGSVDVGTTAHLEGIIVTQTSLTMRTGASIHGRLLAQTAVELDGATVTAP